MDALRQNFEHHSIFEGIDDELVLHFAKEELQNNQHISKKSLQRIARKKATMQRLKWIIQDITLGLVLFAIVGVIFLSVFLAYSL